MVCRRQAQSVYLCALGTCKQSLRGSLLRHETFIDGILAGLLTWRSKNPIACHLLLLMSILPLKVRLSSRATTYQSVELKLEAGCGTQPLIQAVESARVQQAASPDNEPGG